MKSKAWQALAWLLYHATPSEWRQAANAIREAQGARLAAEALTPLIDLPWNSITRRRGRSIYSSEPGTHPGEMEKDIKSFQNMYREIHEVVENPDK